MMSIDLNFSGYQHKKGENAIQNLKNLAVPELRVYNAEQCYHDAKKLHEAQLLDVKQLRLQIKTSPDGDHIVSHYTSPFYLANLTLLK